MESNFIDSHQVQVDALIEGEEVWLTQWVSNDKATPPQYFRATVLSYGENYVNFVCKCCSRKLIRPYEEVVLRVKNGT